MELLLIFLSLVFGLFVGSFLNVIILRLNTGISFMSGRSICLNCSTQLEVGNLTPVISFFVLGGRCGFCKSKISRQYPIVELMTGLLFALATWTAFSSILSYETLYLVFFLLEVVVLWLALSSLIIIIVYDWRHKIIPNKLVYFFIGLSFLYLVLNNSGENFLWSFLAGPILFIPFYLLWFISRGRWIGLGDGKLAWGFGWFLGLSGGISAIVYGFWVGALYALAILVRQYFSGGVRIGAKTEIPFAPFLIAGFLIVLFSGLGLPEILGLSNSFIL